MSKKPVVVYGASGYTGRLICEALRNYQIPVHCRRPRQEARRRSDAAGSRHRDRRLRSGRRQPRCRRARRALRQHAGRVQHRRTVPPLWRARGRGCREGRDPLPRHHRRDPVHGPRAREVRRRLRRQGQGVRAQHAYMYTPLEIAAHIVLETPGSTRWKRSAARSARRPTDRRSRSSRCSRRRTPRSTSSTANARSGPGPWLRGQCAGHGDDAARAALGRRHAAALLRARCARSQLPAAHHLQQPDDVRTDHRHAGDVREGHQELPAAERAAASRPSASRSSRHAAARESAGAPLRRARPGPRRQPVGVVHDPQLHAVSADRRRPGGDREFPDRWPAARRRLRLACQAVGHHEILGQLQNYGLVEVTKS